MTVKLVDGLGAAIGCRFLRKHNQLTFVEYTKGAISLLDMVSPMTSILSQGTILLKGTWVFDCETGALGGNTSGPGDIWWEQIDNVKRQMVPVGGAKIVNLGKVNFASITPAVLQTLNYSSNPIPGNNDPTNQLVNDDVFAVKTKAGNVAKVRVVQYGYNMQIQYVTYKLASPYHIVGTGYTTPEDIAVASDENTAYVTERTGNLLRVNLSNANRSAAVVVASGMQAPQQIYLDELHQQAYVVEYANPGRLIRIDLTTGQKTTLLDGLSNAVGLLISSDLAYAYISEQSAAGGRITRYSLQGGANVQIASGLISPFFLSWVDAAQSTMFVAERDPANRITMVDTAPHPGSVRQLANPLGVRPSCMASIDASHLLVCCDQEIDLIDILEGVVPAGLFKGIGLVPWNLITAAGKADTTTQPQYPYQFAKDSPFGGVLSLQINHSLAWQSGVTNYRILVDGNVRLDTWHDLKLNPVNGKYEIPVEFKPTIIAGQPGYYPIHPPGEWYMNTDLGMVLDSTGLPNGLRSFKIDFTNSLGVVLQSQSLQVLIDNNHCVAMIQMPSVSGNSATTDCGMLKFASTSDPLQIVYIASHPSLFGTYSFWIVKAANSIYSTSANVSNAPFTFQNTVGSLLGMCTRAAFCAQLYVYAKAINGYTRQTQYDASAIVAFALTP
jgi:hypothetical protein